MNTKIANESNDDVYLRAAPATYGILCGVWMVPALIGLLAWMKNGQGFVVFLLSLLGMGLFGVWLRFFQLRLSKTHFYYRSMLGGRVCYPRSKISRARVVTGYRSLLETTKPFIRLEIDGVTDHGFPKTISVNIRLFSKSIATVIKELT